MADYYLGYTELEGDLYTLSGILHTFSNFASTQPDSVSENCVTIYGSTGIYYDESCSAKHFGVCSSIPNSAKSHQETTNAITTTTIPSSSIVDTNCICSCSMTYDLNPKVNLTAEQEAEIKEIKRNLTVEKSTLSSSVRRRTSAPDDRRSSQTVGLFGICFLTLTFGFLVFADCIRAIDLINCQQRHDIFTFH
ncbi:uncharacterized protein LOC134263317 [Saccostrea cucullata]|uniref:uncharacterized protein LOC134263317 n=1 Tax=Saccostrea cuccullata TaxID=36930 RepID=UPI002ED109D1